MVMKSDLQLKTEGVVQDAIEALRLLHADMLGGRIDVDLLADQGGREWADDLAHQMHNLMRSIAADRTVFGVPEERE